MKTRSIRTLTALQKERQRLEAKAEFSAIILKQKSARSLVAKAIQSAGKPMVPSMIGVVAKTGMQVFSDVKPNQPTETIHTMPAEQDIVTDIISSFEDYQQRSSAKWAAFIPVAMRLFTAWQAARNQNNKEQYEQIAQKPVHANHTRIAPKQDIETTKIQQQASLSV